MLRDHIQTYESSVLTRFILYNSLFSNLPYQGMVEISTYLQLFQTACTEGLESGKDPSQIVEEFLNTHWKNAAESDRFGYLFKFIQFIERQIVLFDALEDAAFEQFHDLNGPGSLHDLFARIRNSADPLEWKEELSLTHLRLVLTAHPTQFYTGEVLGIITDLDKAFRRNDLNRIDELLLQLSRTPFLNKEKPSPFEEASRLSWYLRNILYKAIADIQVRLMDFYLENKMQPPSLIPVEIGFWPGGDRDGNPFVTSETSLRVANLLKKSILDCYLNEIKVLKRRLTFRHVNELILDIEQKLSKTFVGEKQGAYTGATDFMKDLQHVADTLKNEHEGIFVEYISTLMDRVRLFGFHFANLDIRQNRKQHMVLLDKIFAANGLKSDKEQIRKAIVGDDLKIPAGELTELESDILQTVETAVKIQQENGPQAVHRYIISNACGVEDVYSVMLLFRLAGVNVRDLNFDVIPLFESVEDLHNAGNIMDELYSDPMYKEHLARRNKKQIIMLGFSDGTKDGGYLTANWQIYKAKERLSIVSESHGVRVVFFDGRGGPPARGGGNTHNFYASLGSSIAKNQIQLTIQGQTVSSNYGTHEAAVYNMEQLVNARLASRLNLVRGQDLSENQENLITELSDLSYQAYSELKAHKHFITYLEEFSPIRYFGTANIGSRPVSRKGGNKMHFEDLRAITFVGAWTHLKQNIPGFYGMGSAMAEFEKAGRMHELQALYRDSLFFRTLLENSMMSLAKTNFRLTAWLAEDPEFGDYWKMLFAERELSIRMLLKVTGLKELMDPSPINKRSVTFREQLVIPLLVIQQYALRNIREKESSGNDLKHYKSMLVRTLYGITNAGRNSV